MLAAEHSLCIGSHIAFVLTPILGLLDRVERVAMVLEVNSLHGYRSLASEHPCWSVDLKHIG